MKALVWNSFRRCAALMPALCLAFEPAAWAQGAYEQAAPQQDAAPEALPPPQPAFNQQQLDQMLAPIALYPDPLLSQILMAATYPLEVVEAARWSRANPGLTGDAAVRAVEQQDWDPSVKSLVAFPRILLMMDERLEWTEKLGDAFLAQQAQVMDAVQSLRRKAYDAGNLRSNDEVRVQAEGETIVVVPANPDMIYVPYYDPTVVYGAWWWPDYPPVYWPPWPGYAVTSGFAWGAGIIVTSGFFFGGCDWPHRRVVIVNVNNFSHPRPAPGGRRFPHRVNEEPGPWHHDPDHRRGVPYRDIRTRNRYAPLPGPPEFRGNPPRFEQRPVNAGPPGEAGRPAPVPGAGQERERAEKRTRPETSAQPGAHGVPETQAPSGAPIRPETPIHPEPRRVPEVQPVPGIRAVPRPAPEASPNTESQRRFERREQVEPQPRPEGGREAPRQFERRPPGRETAPEGFMPGGGEGSEGSARSPGRIRDGGNRGDFPGGGEERRAR